MWETLLLGEFERCWRECLYRYCLAHMNSVQRKCSARAGTASAFPGKTLLIDDEQGFGDALNSGVQALFPDQRIFVNGAAGGLGPAAARALR